MRSSHVVPIDSDPHFEDYAEMPSWDEKVTDRLKKDEEAATLFGLAISFGVIFLLVYVLPAVWRWWR